MRTEIIAEIGVNANGDIAEAKSLVDRAKKAGANVVKFQATYPRIEMSEHYMLDRIEMTEKVILSHAQLEDLAHYCCHHAGIEFLCTPSEVESLRWLVRRINPDRIKIGSDNLTNIPMLQLAASYGLPIILSTGIGSLAETDEAYGVLRRGGLSPDDIVLMHCTTSYPCAHGDANLRCIATMRARYSCRVGWSDHTNGVMLASVAVGMGASMIEKHITHSRLQAGPDHKASAEVSEFEVMARLIRQTEDALGSGDKVMRECERENARLLRKSVVARRDIKAGEKLDIESLAIMRPGYGEPPKRIAALVGTQAARAYRKGELI